MEPQENITLDSIDAYNKIYGLATRHPLVSVIDLKEATRRLDRCTLKYGVYAIFLKNGVGCTIKYGREYYDYQEGTIVSFAPGQVIDVDSSNHPVNPDVVGLMFHPDLICGTPLGSAISKYGFFGYSQKEALHLSEMERSIFLDCIDKIKSELEHPVDTHSADLLSANIQLLLEYLNRFYDRQFITRHKVNSSVVAAFEKELDRIYAADASVDMVPRVSYFAEKANLTPGYFSDLVKKETGSTPQQIITLHLVKEAKRRLASSDRDVSEIAYSLGFDYPQHFSRLFKRATGKTPLTFRNEIISNN